MSIFLQLETALADARASRELAGEKLHDAATAHALAKSEYDAASETVKRLEGALNSMHGVTSPPSAVAVAHEREPECRPATKKPREPKADQGPACPSCTDVGKLSAPFYKGVTKWVTCGGCNGEFQVG